MISEEIESIEEMEKRANGRDRGRWINEGKEKRERLPRGQREGGRRGEGGEEGPPSSSMQLSVIGMLGRERERERVEGYSSHPTDYIKVP